VIVIYVSFLVDGDLDDLDNWIIPLFQKERQEPGVVAYDYLIDQEQPTRRRVVEVFADRESAKHHVTSAAHIEMLALGSMVYGMRDFEMHVWGKAEQYRHSTRPRSDSHVDGREQAEQLISEFQRRYAESRQN
jgi:quinol monooxygenase YgiN